MRINARLDETTQQQLQYLIETTGQNASLVVRESVAQYYVQVKQRQKVPSRFLALAGTGDSGGGDIASNISHYYAQALAEKYPQHLGVPAATSRPAPEKKAKARSKAKVA